jgi:large subunit ribosomal protein L4
MENLKVAGKKPLIILPEANKNVYLSARNLQYVNVTTISELNTYKILNAKSLIIVQAALDGLDQIFKA